jgi:hypothetical protein
MAFKGISDIVGRTVAGVVVKEGNSAPCSQVFFIFDDGRAYELYGSDLPIKGSWMPSNDGLPDVLNYLPNKRIVEQYPAPGGKPAPSPRPKAEALGIPLQKSPPPMKPEDAKPMSRMQVLRNRGLLGAMCIGYLVVLYMTIEAGSGRHVTLVSLLLSTGALGVVAIAAWVGAVEILAPPLTRGGRLGWLIAGMLAAIVRFSVGRSSYQPLIWVLLTLMIPTMAAWALITWHDFDRFRRDSKL